VRTWPSGETRVVERSYTLREEIEVMHPLQAVAYLAQISD